MRQFTIFAFRDDPLCFMHVLLNAIDLSEKGLGGRIVFEGEATKLIPAMADKTHFLHFLYAKVKQLDLIEGACRACSNKIGVLDAVAREQITLIGELSGHPAMSKYIAAGHEIVVM